MSYVQSVTGILPFLLSKKLLSTILCLSSSLKLGPDNKFGLEGGLTNLDSISRISRISRADKSTGLKLWFF